MATTSIDGEVDNWWRELLRLCMNLFRRAAKRPRGSGMRSIDLWAEKFAEHEEVLALRMAANFRSEDYEVITARVEKDAARYRAFLQQPEAIGRISLFIKRFALEGEEDELPRQLYQVLEPTEGQAAMSYDLERSDRRVLEFVVHDKDDRPLFPIVRTYSNWIGSRQFNLGLGRTFTLKMAASESSESVRVHAGFTTAQADESEDAGMIVANGNRPLAANTIHNGGSWQLQTDALSWSYGRRLAFLLCIECLVVSVMASKLVVQADSNKLMAATASAASVYQPYVSAPITSQAFAENLSGETHGIEVWIGDAEAPGVDESGNLTGNDKRARAGDGNGLMATRIAALMEGHLKLDDALCRQAGDRCRELHVNINNLGNKVLYFQMGQKRSLPWGAPTQTFETLLTAHQHGEANSGLIHVTFLTGNKLLLIKEAGCTENKEGDTNYFAGNSHEGFSRETADVQMISASTESRVETQDAAEAERESRVFKVD